MAAYEAVVQRDLVAPLQRWALESYDPVIRNAGIELANVAALLHKMSPLLSELQSSQFERGRRGDIEPIPMKMFGQSLALTARFAGLMRDLRQWRKG
jgi:hypothetical protein